MAADDCAARETARSAALIAARFAALFAADAARIDATFLAAGRNTPRNGWRSPACFAADRQHPPRLAHPSETRLRPCWLAVSSPVLTGPHPPRACPPRAKLAAHRCVVRVDHLMGAAMSPGSVS